AVATGAGHGISYWGAGRETDSLTPPNGRAGVTAALYLAFYAGAGLPAVGVGLLSMNASLTWAITLVSMVMVLAMTAFLPLASRVASRPIRASLATPRPVRPTSSRAPDQTRLRRRGEATHLQTEVAEHLQAQSARG